MIRIANPKTDSKAIADIYKHYVENTWISFEMKAPDEMEMSNRIRKCLELFPWLVYLVEDAIVGYAYAGPHRARKAYQWSAECSVYLDAENHSKGLGSQLYNELFRIMTAQGFKSLYAGISLPNDQSEVFHRKMGFSTVGTYHKVGYKFERWFDVLWLEKELIRDDEFEAIPPTPIQELSLPFG